MIQPMSEQVSDLVQLNKIESFGPYGGKEPSTHRYDDRGYGRIYHHFPKEETWRWIPGSQRSGGFGSVWKITSAEETKASDLHLRAVKQIQKATGRARPLMKTSRELEAAFKFSDNDSAPRFVRSYGWFEDADYVFLAMEYLAHGDLRNFMSRPLSETAVQRITSQLVDGLFYMHQNGFTHRDLKPENVLVVQPHPEWKVKLGDFGISKFVHHDTKLETFAGTLDYMAPEIWGNGQPYTSAVDMWSLGITVFEMLTLELNKLEDTEPLQRQPLLDHKVSEPCQSFLEKLLVFQPDQRMSSESAASHLWIQSQCITSSPHALVGARPLASSQDSNESDHSGTFYENSKPKPVPKNVSPQHGTAAAAASTRNDMTSSETSECNGYTVYLMGPKGPILKLDFKNTFNLEFHDLHYRLVLGLTRMQKHKDGDHLKLSYLDTKDNIRKALDNDEDLLQALAQGDKLHLYHEQPEQSSRPERPQAAPLVKIAESPHLKAQSFRLQVQGEESSSDSHLSPWQVGKHVRPLEEVASRSNAQGTQRLAASPDASSQEILVATQPWADSQDLLKIKSSQHDGLSEPTSSMAIAFHGHRESRYKGEAKDQAKSRSGAKGRDNARTGDDARRDDKGRGNTRRGDTRRGDTKKEPESRRQINQTRSIWSHLRQVFARS